MVPGFAAGPPHTSRRQILRSKPGQWTPSQISNLKSGPILNIGILSMNNLLLYCIISVDKGAAMTWPFVSSILWVAVFTLDIGQAGSIYPPILPNLMTKCVKM